MKVFKFRYYIIKLTLTLVAILIVFMILYPLMYDIMTSIVSGQTLVTSINDMTKRGLSVSHYLSAITDPHFINATIISIMVALVNIILSLLIITPAAYAFSRFEFFGKNTLLILYLILSQIGGGFGIASVIALYVFLLKLNALGLPVIGNPLVLPIIYTSTAVPFQTWLIKNYFDSLPKSLDEAAFIDGVRWNDIIFRVILPASKPAIIIIALFAFMGAWGEFIIANFLRIETLAAYIYETATGQTIYWSDFAARTLLFAIPIIIMYVLTQKYIGEAMKYGAGKL
ncbi:MAG: ABC transporter permease subunit [Thermoprotei archaeon]|jgi:arabinogalactan oligomer/maltooligosaccharide transport system permease protein